MTETEYIASIPAETWQYEAETMAIDNISRVLNVPGVMEAILEEFNNDVYDYMVQLGEEQGLIDTPEEDPDDN